MRRHVQSVCEAQRLTGGKRPLLMATSVALAALAAALPWSTQPLLKSMCALLAATSLLFHATHHPVALLADWTACRAVACFAVAYAVLFHRRLLMPPACFGAALLGVAVLYYLPRFRLGETRGAPLTTGAHAVMHVAAGVGLACLWFRDAPPAAHA